MPAGQRAGPWRGIGLHQTRCQNPTVCFSWEICLTAWVLAYDEKLANFSTLLCPAPDTRACPRAGALETKDER
jgi:hypothetical protein